MGEREHDEHGSGVATNGSRLRALPRQIPVEALAPGRRLRLEATEGDLVLACTVEVSRIDDHGIVVRTLDPVPGPFPEGPDGHRPPEPFAVGSGCQFRVPVEGALLVGQTCVLEDTVTPGDPHSRVLRLAVPTGASRLQRRRHRRIPYDGPVRYRSAIDDGPRRWRSGTAVDLSAGGLRLITAPKRRSSAPSPPTPPVGEVLDLRFPLPDATGVEVPLDVSAVVVGTSRSLVNGTHLHIRFTHLGGDELDRLKEFVAQRK
jgi:hypothetical protein